MIKIDQTKLSEICREYGVVAIYLHGSRVKGNAVKDSDTDVAVVVEDRKKFDFKEQIAFDDKLERVIKLTNPDIKMVDINISPIFLFSVVKEGKLIYKKSEEDRVNFESLVMRRYYDMDHLCVVYRNYLYSAVKGGVYAS